MDNLDTDPSRTEGACGSGQESNHRVPWPQLSPQVGNDQPELRTVDQMLLGLSTAPVRGRAMKEKEKAMGGKLSLDPPPDCPEV